METALKAIAEPRRRAILQLVRGVERSAGEIAANFEITGPAVSQHLAVLLEAGLVEMRRDGVRRLYRANEAGMQELKRFFDAFWGEGLARLKTAAEAEQLKREGTAGRDGRPRDQREEA